MDEMMNKSSKRLFLGFILLASLGLYFVFGKQPDEIVADRYKQKQTELLLRNMRLIVERRYMRDCKRPPPSELGLRALWEPGGVKGWAGPYMKVEEFTIRDEWGSPLKLESSDTGFVLRSAGRDTVFNTRDDLTEETSGTVASWMRRQMVRFWPRWLWRAE